MNLELPRPDPSLHPVGRDHSGRVGRLQLELLRRSGLQPDNSVLEIGCGIGRLAYELASFLSPAGIYAGFDISEPAIAWLRRNYTTARPNFTFTHVPAANNRYHPDGEVNSDQIAFPYASDQFDLVCAFSVFTHMRLNDVAHYMEETRRVLRPQGTAVLTYFLISANDINPQLKDQRFTALNQHEWVLDRELPERAIAFNARTVSDLVQASQLQLLEQQRGIWRGGPRNPGFHKDVLILTKPRKVQALI